MWFEEKIKPGDLRKMSVGYHKAIKRLAGMNVWESNHAACEKIDVNIFEHLLNKRLLKFYFDLINSRCTIVKNLRYDFMLNSSLYFRVTRIFENSYNVVGLCHNDKMALLSRVDFVERNEPRSNHIYDPSGT